MCPEYLKESGGTRGERRLFDAGARPERPLKTKSLNFAVACPFETCPDLWNGLGR